MVEPIQGEKGVIIPPKGISVIRKDILKKRMNFVKSITLFWFVTKFKLE